LTEDGQWRSFAFYEVEYDKQLLNPTDAFFTNQNQECDEEYTSENQTAIGPSVPVTYVAYTNRVQNKMVGHFPILHEFDWPCVQSECTMLKF